MNVSSDQNSVPLAQRVVQGGLWAAGSSYVTVVVGFTATVIMARLLSPKDFGTLAIANFIFGILNVRGKLTLGQAYIRQPESSGRALGTLLALELGISGVSFFFALIGAPFLHLLGYDADVAGVVIAMALINILNALAGIPAAMLDRNLRMGYNSAILAICFPLSYLPAIFLAAKGWQVWSLVVQLALQNIFVTCATFWVAHKELRHEFRLRWSFDRALAKEFLRFGATLSFAVIAGFLATQFDNFLVGTFVGLATLGFYDRAYRFASIPDLLVSNIVARNAFLAYSRLQNDRARLSKTLDMTIWIITALAFPLALVLFVIAPDLIEFLLGSQWLPSVVYLRFLLIYSLIRPIQEDLGALLIALGKTHLVSIALWIENIILLVVALALTLMFGAAGTAIGVGAAFGIGCLILFRWAVREIDVAWAARVGQPVMITLLALAIYYFANGAFNWNDFDLFPRLLLKTFFTFALFYALLLSRECHSEHIRFAQCKLREESCSFNRNLDRQ
ncbi:MAG: oligosaccharide flippase family protein [Chloroflexi bacterium]|nr:oligosaccharide flippase family protein [Chloroflexota bacterium]